MGEMVNLASYYKGKKVLVTGNTGFKGSWMSKMLLLLGADVYGLALKPQENDLFFLAGLDKQYKTYYSDVRDYESVEKAIKEVKPDVVFHLAAQPLVRESYKNPKYTYETNVLGTVNLLEALRNSESVKSILNVTTDKVYLNREWAWGYREDEMLDGYDPYSNSKSCSELVTHSYYRSFFSQLSIPVSTARAGNVIGGGDFSADRIIPDCVRAAVSNKEITVRNPYSIRPYQFVLEPVYAYLLIAMKQEKDSSKIGSYNVGPNDSDCVTTGTLCDLFVSEWKDGVRWVSKADGGPHEANFLKLDCSKIKSVMRWEPKTDIKDAVGLSVEWYKAWAEKADYNAVMEKQINKYID